MLVSPYRILSLVLPIFILSGQLGAQPADNGDPGSDSLSRYIQTKYGLDQELFSGFQYYKRYVQYKGDPFFPEDSFYGGSVTIRGVEHGNVRLKYNCYTQSLILEYTDFGERYNQLRLNNIQIDSFKLGKYDFQKRSLFSQAPLFYQVLSSGPVIFYIHWEKIIHTTTSDFQYTHEYTRAIGTYYVSYKGEIHAFNNRKSFSSIFPESMQKEMMRYFRQNGLSLREAGPDDFQKLLDHLSQMLEKPSVN